MPAGTKIVGFKSFKNSLNMERVQIAFQWFDENDKPVGRQIGDNFALSEVDTPEKIADVIALVNPAMSRISGITGPDLAHFDAHLSPAIIAAKEKAAAAKAALAATPTPP